MPGSLNSTPLAKNVTSETELRQKIDSLILSMRSEREEESRDLKELLSWQKHPVTDTDDLMAEIRRVLLPHLRPPVTGVDVPGPDGDYGDIQELCDAEGVDVRIGAPLLRRAFAAWEQTHSSLGQVVLPEEIADALINAECALADIAEGEIDSNSPPTQELWAESRAAEALTTLRPLMHQYKIRTSE